MSDPIDADRRFFADLRAREFGRLDRAGHAYLDYTGSGLYGRSQLAWHREWLDARVLGNPHSESPASLATSEAMERIRSRLLDFFGADPEGWELVFTANASAALKLVGEAFPFERGSRLVLSADNHNSVVGIREFARRAGARVTVLPLDDELRLVAEGLPDPPRAPSLLALPAQSNFSGVKHPRAIVDQARRAGYRVLWDTAAYAPTNWLRLGEDGPDFACVSFYKMFGYPTGLGVLLARRPALAELRRPSFAGGTVDFVSIRHDTHRLQNHAHGFEDGTPDFLGIPALQPGLDLLDEVRMDRLRRRVDHLTGRLLDGLLSLRRPDGSATTVVYGPAGTDGRGGAVAFNVLDRRGRPLPYERVEVAARAAGVSLRGGCFCNPGAAESAFRMPDTETARCLESLRDSFTVPAYRDCLSGEVAVGAVRASLGVASNEADVDRALEVVESLTRVPPASWSGRGPPRCASSAPRGGGSSARAGTAGP